MRQVPNWSQYFMAMAETAATRSKDPATQVGAVVVSKNNRLLGCGYNGMPEGYVEDAAIWERPLKYDHVCHAELNAILNCEKPPVGGKVFVTLFPCKQCAKVIAAARIKKVYYKDHILDGRDFLDPVSVDIFKRACIEVTQVKGS